MEEKRKRASASFVAGYILRLSQSTGLGHHQSFLLVIAFAFKAMLIRKVATRLCSRSQLDCFELLASRVTEVNAIAYLQD